MFIGLCGGGDSHTASRFLFTIISRFRQKEGYSMFTFALASHSDHVICWSLYFHIIIIILLLLFVSFHRRVRLFF